MSLGVASGQASAASSSLRLLTVCVREAEALDPPVVPWGRAGVGTEAQPSLAGNTSRPGSEAGEAACAAPRRKPMDRTYANIRARHGENIDFPHENRCKSRPLQTGRRNDTGDKTAGVPRGNQVLVVLISLLVSGVAIHTVGCAAGLTKCTPARGAPERKR